jgi:hypothetical protein
MKWEIHAHKAALLGTASGEPMILVPDQGPPVFVSSLTINGVVRSVHKPVGNGQSTLCFEAVGDLIALGDGSFILHC